MPESRYRITERVAAGGMAEVFRGVAESLQGFRKNIAIKRVLPALTKNKKFVAMFLDEARLSLALQHANIVQVFDIGHVDDTYFIVMEFVDGVDMKALLEWRRRINKRLSVAQTLYIISEVCKALSYAHELLNPETGKPLGIVHRDISPPNVLISKQGEVKVVDFGLAKAQSQLESTDPGVVKGKMSYLSPEAARGEEVDNKADIFAVGILLYEMLTGKRLFYGESDYQTVELVRNARIPPIRAQNHEVEPELEGIVRRALARRTEDRFRTATDLQDALAHYMYSRGLKVIARDIAALVRECLDDRAAQSGGTPRPGGRIVDALVQEEINQFTSVDFQEENGRVDELNPFDPYEGPSSTDDLIDPRAWASEPGTGAGRRPTGAIPAESARRVPPPSRKTAELVFPPHGGDPGPTPPPVPRRPTGGHAVSPGAPDRRDTLTEGVPAPSGAGPSGPVSRGTGSSPGLRPGPRPSGAFPTSVLLGGSGVPQAAPSGASGGVAASPSASGAVRVGATGSTPLVGALASAPIQVASPVGTPAASGPRLRSLFVGMAIGLVVLVGVIVLVLSRRP